MLRGMKSNGTCKAGILWEWREQCGRRVPQCQRFSAVTQLLLFGPVSIGLAPSVTCSLSFRPLVVMRPKPRFVRVLSSYRGISSHSGSSDSSRVEKPDDKHTMHALSLTKFNLEISTTCVKPGKRGKGMRSFQFGSLCKHI
jgi:hypothetical protein